MRYKIIMTTLVGAASLAACASGTKVHSAAGEIAPATPTSANFIPAGTMTTARFNQNISINNREGDHFTATVVNPVVATNGAVAIPRGAVFHGVVTGVHSANVPGDRNVIRLDVNSLEMHGRMLPFVGSISNVKVENASGASNRTALNTLIGGAAGVALGGLITGGEAAGLITGGILGAGAGAIISLNNGSNHAATIPQGSMVTIQATEGVRVR